MKHREICLRAFELFFNVEITNNDEECELRLIKMALPLNLDGMGLTNLMNIKEAASVVALH